MLSLGLYLAMCYHTVAPHLILPGMMPEEVEAILGCEPDCLMLTGPFNGGALSETYFSRKVTVVYRFTANGPNGVWAVRHHTPKSALLDDTTRSD